MVLSVRRGHGRGDRGTAGKCWEQTADTSESNRAALPEASTWASPAQAKGHVGGCLFFFCFVFEERLLFCLCAQPNAVGLDYFLTARLQGRGDVKMCEATVVSFPIRSPLLALNNTGCAPFQTNVP